MHISGHGRNEIARLLTEQGLHVSEGSVGNIVRAYRQHELPLKSDATISTGSPSSIAQLGVGTKPTTSSNVVTPKNGGPLSHLLVNMTDSPIEPTLSTITNSVAPPTNPEELDFSDNPYPESYPNPDSHVDNISDIDDKYVIKETEEIEEASEEPNQPQPPIRNSENQSTLAGIDWDERWEDRFWARIMEEKEEKRHQLMLIEEQKELMLIERHNLDQVSQNIDQRENDLRMRETRIKEVEPLLPSVRELQRMNVTFQIILPYIMAINEKAVAENIDLTTSAYNLVQDIHQYRELGTLQSTIKDLEERVSALNELNTQKQAAVITFMDLQLMGYSNKEITELVETISRWKGGPGLASPGLGQANDHKLDTELICN